MPKIQEEFTKLVEAINNLDINRVKSLAKKPIGNFFLADFPWGIKYRYAMDRIVDKLKGMQSVRSRAVSNSEADNNSVELKSGGGKEKPHETCREQKNEIVIAMAQWFIEERMPFTMQNKASSTLYKQIELWPAILGHPSRFNVLINVGLRDNWLHRAMRSQDEQRLALLDEIVSVEELRLLVEGIYLNTRKFHGFLGRHFFTILKFKKLREVCGEISKELIQYKGKRKLADISEKGEFIYDLDGLLFQTPGGCISGKMNDKVEDTLLTYSVWKGYKKMIKHVMASSQCQRLLHCDGEKGFTALDFAVVRGHHKVLGQLINSGASISPIVSSLCYQFSLDEDYYDLLELFFKRVERETKRSATNHGNIFPALLQTPSVDPDFPLLYKKLTRGSLCRLDEENSMNWLEAAFIHNNHRIGKRLLKYLDRPRLLLLIENSNVNKMLDCLEQQVSYSEEWQKQVLYQAILMVPNSIYVWAHDDLSQKEKRLSCVSHFVSTLQNDQILQLLTTLNDGAIRARAVYRLACEGKKRDGVEGLYRKLVVGFKIDEMIKVWKQFFADACLDQRLLHVLFESVAEEGAETLFDLTLSVNIIMAVQMTMAIKNSNEKLFGFLKLKIERELELLQHDKDQDKKTFALQERFPVVFNSIENDEAHKNVQAQPAMRSMLLELNQASLDAAISAGQWVAAIAILKENKEIKVTKQQRGKIQSTGSQDAKDYMSQVNFDSLFSAAEVDQEGGEMQMQMKMKMKMKMKMQVMGGSKRV